MLNLSLKSLVGKKRKNKQNTEIKNWFCILKIENRIEGGTSDFHGLAKVRENKQADYL